MAPQLPFPCYLPAFAIVAPFAVGYGDIFSLACYLGYDRMERLSNRSKEQATRSPHSVRCWNNKGRCRAPCRSLMITDSN